MCYSKARDVVPECARDLQLRAASAKSRRSSATFNTCTRNPNPSTLTNPHPTITMAFAWKAAGLTYARPLLQPLQP
jgi:hypothetical protein